MAILTIRKLPDEVHARLRVRAAIAGRSTEAEARAIISDACAPNQADPGRLLAGPGHRSATPVAAQDARASQVALASQRYWDAPTLEELAKEQGITSPQDMDALFGAGAELWQDDEESDRFLDGIYKRRRESLAAERQ